jgi:hypothetical protein
MLIKQEPRDESVASTAHHMSQVIHFSFLTSPNLANGSYTRISSLDLVVLQSLFNFLFECLSCKTFVLTSSFHLKKSFYVSCQNGKLSHVRLACNCHTGATTLSITTLSIKGLFARPSINNTQHKQHSA